MVGESRLTWFDYVLAKDEGCVGRIVIEMKLPEKREESPKKVDEGGER